LRNKEISSVNLAVKSPFESKDIIDDLAAALLHPMGVEGVHARGNSTSKWSRACST
jgi:hypothetical protein